MNGGPWEKVEDLVDITRALSSDGAKAVCSRSRTLIFFPSGKRQSADEYSSRPDVDC